MSYRSRQGRRPSGRKVLLIFLGIIALYAAVILGIRLVGSKIEYQDAKEPVGSLEQRFVINDITLSYHNRTWSYRKNALTNILLIGMDWDEMAQGAVSVRYGGQADFLLLLSIDKKSKTINTFHIDRDTITPIRIYGPFGDYSGTRSTQICLSYAYGDTTEACCENTVWSVGNLLGGIPIDAYLVMDMDGIAALNDAIGGVEVTLEDDFSHLDPLMTKGKTLLLQGKQAEFYVRGRMTVGDGTNESRMQRQRVYMRNAGDIICSAMAKDMGYAGTLLDQLSDHVTTNMERGWLINKAYEIRKYERPDAVTIAGIHCVGEDGFMEFHPDTDALQSLLIKYFFE